MVSWANDAAREKISKAAVRATRRQHEEDSGSGEVKMTKADRDDVDGSTPDLPSFGLLIKDIHHMLVGRADPLITRVGLTFAQFNLLKAISR